MSVDEVNTTVTNATAAVRFLLPSVNFWNWRHRRGLWQMLVAVTYAIRHIYVTRSVPLAVLCLSHECPTATVRCHILQIRTAVVRSPYDFYGQRTVAVTVTMLRLSYKNRTVTIRPFDFVCKFNPSATVKPRGIARRVKKLRRPYVPVEIVRQPYDFVKFDIAPPSCGICDRGIIEATWAMGPR